MQPKIQILMAYKERIADKILLRRLAGKGAVQIAGPKWCGKTTTAKQVAKSVLDLGDAGLTFPEGSVSTPANVAPLQKTSPAVTRAPQTGSFDTSANFRNTPQMDVPDFASQNRFPTYNDLQNAKNVDKPERRVKEIRVF